MLRQLSPVLLAASIAFAQQESPCGVYRVSSIDEAELVGNNFVPWAIGVLDLTLAPDPNVAGAYFGFGRFENGPSINPTTHAFRWQPGSSPVRTTLVGVTMPNRVVDIAIAPLPDSGGKMTVVVHRETQTSSGVNRQIVMSKVTPDASAVPSDDVIVKSFSGFTSASSSPSLGRINGQDVLFYADASLLHIADIDTEPASPNYGQLTNERSFSPPLGSHHPTPIAGPNGETRSLLWLSGGGFFESRIHYADTPDPLLLPLQGQTISTVQAFPPFSGPVPTSLAVLDGSTFVATRDLAEPLRLQVVSTSSTAAHLGQTATFDVRIPTSNPAAPELCIALMTLSGNTPPAPLPGLALGNLCVSDTALVIESALVNNTGHVTFGIAVPNVPSLVGVLVYLQGGGSEAGAPSLFLGNTAWLEISN